MDRPDLGTLCLDACPTASPAGCRVNGDCQAGSFCDRGECTLLRGTLGNGGSGGSGGTSETSGAQGGSSSGSGANGSSAGQSSSSIGASATSGGPQSSSSSAGCSCSSSCCSVQASATSTKTSGYLTCQNGSVCYGSYYCAYNGTDTGACTSTDPCGGQSGTWSCNGSSSGGSSSGGSSSGGAGTGAITCSAPDTGYKANGGSCGTERWSVKTGTDNDVLMVNLAPQVTTIAALAALPVPANQSAACNRSAPTETQVWELQDVNLAFKDLESDSDYHIIATDNSGNTMIVEIPAPSCVGNASCSSNQPLLCDITHARANFDAKNPSNGASLGVGTVMGVGFFDFLHGQDGVAPNGIELHPVLAICFGQGCDPLAGY